MAESQYKKSAVNSIRKIQERLAERLVDSKAHKNLLEVKTQARLMNKTFANRVFNCFSVSALLQHPAKSLIPQPYSNTIGVCNPLR